MFLRLHYSTFFRGFNPFFAISAYSYKVYNNRGRIFAGSYNTYRGIGTIGGRMSGRFRQGTAGSGMANCALQGVLCRPPPCHPIISARRIVPSTYFPGGASPSPTTVSYVPLSSRGAQRRRISSPSPRGRLFLFLLPRRAPCPHNAVNRSSPCLPHSAKPPRRAAGRRLKRFRHAKRTLGYFPSSVSFWSMAAVVARSSL